MRKFIWRRRARDKAPREQAPRKTASRLARMGMLGLLVGLVLEIAHKRLAWEPDAFERGRFASSPAQMTLIGWRDVVLRTARETATHHLMAVAASVAFFALLSLPPALSVLVSIFGLVANRHEIPQQIGPFVHFFPDIVSAFILEQATRLASQAPFAISSKLTLSLVIAGWSANAGIKAIFDAMNVIYEETEKRSYLRVNAISLMLTLSAVLLMTFAMLLIAVAPIIAMRFPFGWRMEFAIVYARWPLFCVVSAIAFAILYWFGPSRRRARFIWVAPGAVTAAVAWAIFSAGFSYYVSNLANYQATYGSLAAVAIFMTWLWVSALVVLIGAELNSQLELQTSRDTTQGDPKPRGHRGAVVADRLGEPML